MGRDELNLPFILDLGRLLSLVSGTLLVAVKGEQLGVLCQLMSTALQLARKALNSSNKKYKTQQMLTELHNTGKS